MHIILSALLVLGGIFDFLIGTGFLFDPVASGTQFGLGVEHTMGASALRGDFTAFFWVAALAMIWGGWKRRGDVLWPALGLFGIAVTGRAINLAVMGSYPGWWTPMTVEIAHVVVITLAMRTWGWRRAR